MWLAHCTPYCYATDPTFFVSLPSTLSPVPCTPSRGLFPYPAIGVWGSAVSSCSGPGQNRPTNGFWRLLSSKSLPRGSAIDTNLHRFMRRFCPALNPQTIDIWWHAVDLSQSYTTLQYTPLSTVCLGPVRFIAYTDVQSLLDMNQISGQLRSFRRRH